MLETTKQGEATASLAACCRMFSIPRKVNGYRIRLAHTPAEQEVVNRLVRRMYAWRGYTMHKSLYRQNNADRATLAVWQGNDAVATLTIGRDASEEGLLADTLYAQELATLRQPGRVICEVTQLAMSSDTHSAQMLNELFLAALLFGKEHFDGSDAVIEVNPRHVRFYQRRFGFSQIGKQRQCPRVKAPAVLLHQTLDGLVSHGATDCLQGLPEDWVNQQQPLAKAI